MNLFGLIIICSLGFEFVLSLLSVYLNVRTLNAPIPGEFMSVIDDNAYKKSQSYSRARLSFGLISSAVSLVVMVGFWLGSGFNWLDIGIRSWGLGVIWTGLGYVGLLLLAKSLLSLPFSLYSTFVIEEKFGFNKTTLATFAADIVKGLLLSVVIGGPFLAALIWIFEFSGPQTTFWIIRRKKTVVTSTPISESATSRL